MRIAVLGGLGLQGRAAIADLAASADVEEIVIGAHLIEAEYVGKDPGELRFELALRRDIGRRQPQTRTRHQGRMRSFYRHLDPSLPHHTRRFRAVEARASLRRTLRVFEVLSRGFAAQGVAT